MATKGKSSKLNGHLTQEDLGNIADLMHDTLETSLATNLAPFATKKDLNESETRIKTELKEYMHGGVETIMDELNRIEDMLTEKEEVEKLKIWAVKVSEKVGIKFN